MEIPDELWNELCYAVENLGKPNKSDSKGDLISRKALKGLISDKSIPIKFEEEKRGDWRCSLGMPLRDIYKTIENAPTVEPCYQTTSCLDCKNYDKENYNCPRFCEVIKEAINSRPQGEWIAQSYETSYMKLLSFKCSKCERVSSEPSKYCPDCGAEMNIDNQSEET